MSHDEVRKAAAGKLWDRALKLQAQVVAGVKEPDDAETALNAARPLASRLRALWFGDSSCSQSFVLKLGRTAGKEQRGQSAVFYCKIVLHILFSVGKVLAGYESHFETLLALLLKEAAPLLRLLFVQSKDAADVAAKQAEYFSRLLTKAFLSVPKQAQTHHHRFLFAGLRSAALRFSCCSSVYALSGDPQVSSRVLGSCDPAREAQAEAEAGILEDAVEVWATAARESMSAPVALQEALRIWKLLRIPPVAIKGIQTLADFADTLHDSLDEEKHLSVSFKLRISLHVSAAEAHFQNMISTQECEASMTCKSEPAEAGAQDKGLRSGMALFAQAAALARESETPAELLAVVAKACHNIGVRLFELQSYTAAAVALAGSCQLWEEFLVHSSPRRPKAKEVVEEGEGEEEEEAEEEDHGDDNDEDDDDDDDDDDILIQDDLLVKSRLSQRFDLLAAARQRAGDAWGAVDAAQGALRFATLRGGSVREQLVRKYTAFKILAIEETLSSSASSSSCSSSSCGPSSSASESAAWMKAAASFNVSLARHPCLIPCVELMSAERGLSSADAGMLLILAVGKEIDSYGFHIARRVRDKDSHSDNSTAVVLFRHVARALHMLFSQNESFSDVMSRPLQRGATMLLRAKYLRLKRLLRERFSCSDEDLGIGSDDEIDTDHDDALSIARDQLELLLHSSTTAKLRVLMLCGEAHLWTAVHILELGEEKQVDFTRVTLHFATAIRHWSVLASYRNSRDGGTGESADGVSFDWEMASASVSGALQNVSDILGFLGQSFLRAKALLLLAAFTTDAVEIAESAVVSEEFVKFVPPQDLTARRKRATETVIAAAAGAEIGTSTATTTTTLSQGRGAIVSTADAYIRAGNVDVAQAMLEISQVLDGAGAEAAIIARAKLLSYISQSEELSARMKDRLATLAGLLESKCGGQSTGAAEFCLANVRRSSGLHDEGMRLSLAALKRRFVVLTGTHGKLASQMQRGARSFAAAATKSKVEASQAGDVLSEKQHDETDTLAAEHTNAGNATGDALRSCDSPSFEGDWKAIIDFVSSIVDCGDSWRRRGLPRRAKFTYRQGLALAKLLHAPAMACMFLLKLGSLSKSLGDGALARELLTEAMKTAADGVEDIVYDAKENAGNGNGELDTCSSLLRGLHNTFLKSRNVEVSVYVHCLRACLQVASLQVESHAASGQGKRTICAPAVSIFQDVIKIVAETKARLKSGQKTVLPRISFGEGNMNNTVVAEHGKEKEMVWLNALSAEAHIGISKCFHLLGNKQTPIALKYVDEAMQLAPLDKKTFSRLQLSKHQLRSSAVESTTAFDARIAGLRSALYGALAIGEQSLIRAAAENLALSFAINRNEVAACFFAHLSLGLTSSMELARLRQDQGEENAVSDSTIEDLDPSKWLKAILARLPSNYKVASLQFAPSGDGLLLTSIVATSSTRGGHATARFVPFKASGSRDAILLELEEVMSGNQETLTGKNRPRSGMSKKQKKAWWKERERLDAALRELLQRIEEEWIGEEGKSVILGVGTGPGMQRSTGASNKETKTELCSPSKLAKHTVKDLRKALSSLSLSTSGKKADLVERLSRARNSDGGTLGRAAESATAESPAATAHVLVLGQGLEGIPFESMGFLSRKRVSRVPGMGTLMHCFDKWDEARKRKKRRLELAFVVDPEGDLKKTAAQFKPKFFEQLFSTADARSDALGVDGLVGAAPTKEEMAGFLESSSWFSFHGHGTGEQFIRREDVARLKSCARVLLWSCSSGRLRSRGSFEAEGMCLSFLFGGSCQVVGNLWDVSSGDCDLFATSVLESIAQGGGLQQALPKAKEGLKLMYLNGAATVVYGLPSL